MSFTFTPAEEVDQKSALIVGLSGLSGSGKTYSALLLAQILAQSREGPVLGIDTENRRMADYKNKAKFPQFHPYSIAHFEAPFSSARYIEALTDADDAGAGCIIVDSGSDEWESEGGVLDLHETTLTRLAGDDYAKRNNMNFPAWAVAKPPHKKFARTIFGLRAHLIICFRAEKKTAMQKIKGSKKMEFVDLGLMPVCGTALPYKLRFHLLMHEGGNGSYDVLKAYEHERHVFPEGGRIDADAGKRLVALTTDEEVPAEPSREVQESPKESKPPPAKADASDSKPFWRTQGGGSYLYVLAEGKPGRDADKALYRKLRFHFEGLKDGHDRQVARRVAEDNKELIEALPKKGREELQKMVEAIG